MIFKGVDFLKKQEGSIKDKVGNHLAYQDQGNVWTIGYGHTGPEVKKGMIIDEDKAQEYLEKDVAWATKAVNNNLLGYSLTQNQFDALVSLTYNIGAAGLADSTVIKRIKAGDYNGAAEALTWWNKVKGKINNGLVNRRAREKALFLKPDDAEQLPLPLETEKEKKIRALTDKFVKDLLEIQNG